MLRAVLFFCVAVYAGICSADAQKDLAYHAAFAEIEMDGLIKEVRTVVDLSKLVDFVIKADDIVSKYKSALIAVLDERLMIERDITSQEADVNEAIFLDQQEREEYGWDNVGHSPATVMLIEKLNNSVAEKNKDIEIEISRDRALIALSTKRDFVKAYVDSRFISQ